MHFRTLFRDICSFVCTKVTRSEIVNVAAQTMNDTVCSPTASAIILHASTTLPTVDGTPSFGWVSLIPLFWCVVLSLIYLMSFPNHLSTTLAAALEKSRAEALRKELSAARVANDNLSSKYQLALDELNSKLKQTIELHDSEKLTVLQAAAEEHAKSIETLVQEHRMKIAATEESCSKEIAKMSNIYEEKCLAYKSKCLDVRSDLRLRLNTTITDHKRATAILERTIKEQSIRLNKAEDEIELLEKKQWQEDLVDDKDWGSLKQKVAQLENEAGARARALKALEGHVKTLQDQLSDAIGLCNATKSEAEEQIKAARAYATRAVLKRARMRKAVAKRSRNTGLLPRIEGQVTAPEAGNIEGHFERESVNAQVTAQTVMNPKIARSPWAIQLQRVTKTVETVEVESLICKESAKNAHDTAEKDLKSAKASLVSSQSELETLRAKWNQEQTDHLRTKSELTEVQQKLDYHKQQNEQLKAQQESTNQSLHDEQVKHLETQSKLTEVKQKLDNCKQHDEISKVQQESTRQSLQDEQIKHLGTQAELTEVKQKLDRCEQHGGQLKAQLKAARKVFHQEQRRGSQVRTQLRKLRRTLQKCRDHGKTLETQLNDNRSAIDDVNAKVAEYALKSSQSNHAPEEAMEPECQLEEAPMEWQNVLAPVTVNAGAVSDHIEHCMELMDVVVQNLETSEWQSEDAPMEDESSGNEVRLVEESTAADSDTAMTAAPTTSESTFPIALALALPIGYQTHSIPYETGLPSQLPLQAPQDINGQLSEVFSNFDRSLLDPALFKDAQMTLPQPEADTPPFAQALGSLAMVNFESRQEQSVTANCPEPPTDPAPLLFNPRVTSLNEFSVTPRPQDVASSQSSPPSRTSAAIEDSHVQTTGPLTNPLPPSPAGTSSVGMTHEAPPVYTSIPSTSLAADPPLRLVQQGKRKEVLPATVEGEGTSAVSARPEGSEECSDREQRPEGQSQTDEIDPNHEIFNGNYDSSDFDDDDDGSTISSIDPRELAAWEARQDKLEAAELKRIDDELKARTRRAGPGPSGSNTAIAERRLIAPKSKKNKCE
ncbi:hypothetical protein MMC26_001757 [Xylographa opegraphella]|nr:hypothetical protein [Xylographa opegraphella]